MWSLTVSIDPLKFLEETDEATEVSTAGLSVCLELTVPFQSIRCRKYDGAQRQSKSEERRKSCTYLEVSHPLCVDLIIQSVPLATEPGISLIILTPMKILQ